MSISTIKDQEEEIRQIAPSGYYIGLRVGFYAPEAEINTFSPEWIDRYTIEALALFDPLRHWALKNVGAKRWSEIALYEDNKVLSLYNSYGCAFGVVLAIHNEKHGSKRSIAYFSRPDRELYDAEIFRLNTIILAAHNEQAHLRLTKAQREVLMMFASGKRHKEIAYELGISQSAVKARIKSAVNKMGATTTAQAAAIAMKNGLL
jgi:DNA-binding CsgD family transcriptional regulator